LISAATTFTLTGFSAGSIQNFVIGTNAGSFTYTGEPAALIVGRTPLNAEAATFVLQGQDAGLGPVQSLPADVGTFVVDGQAANFIRTLRLPAEAAAYSLTGRAAGLYADDYFSNWATQTYGYEALTYPFWWTD
jgi:hypothetical protein